MRNPKIKTSPRLLSMLAAALLTATTLTAATLVAPVSPVQAESQAIVDPARGVADLVDQVMPAVFSVQVKFANVADNGTAAPGDNGGQPDLRGMPDNFRDFFNQFPQFRDQQPGQPNRRERGMAQGSGFIFSADGYAVTNNHVVQNAEEVTVTLHDGDELTAEVIGTDPKTDLALIRLKAPDRAFKFVSFSLEEPRVGDWVMAVGNPFGLGGTVTTGIISARGRDIGSGPYDDFLQIDASINRGNSGGPAFNLKGEVIGINTAIFSPSGGSVGIGFAVPASTAQTIIDSLRKDGTVTRGWLGVQIQPVTADLAESLGLEAGKGALVSEVTDDSPAMKGGLQSGDTILKVDGKEVMDARDLARKVAQIPPKKTVDVAIMRDGKAMTLAVEIGTMSNTGAKLGSTGTDEKTGLASLGLTLAPAADGAGVQITAVEPGSAAEERGLKQGDVILEVAGQQVNGVGDVSNAVKGGKKRVLMLVRSGDGQRFVTVPVNRG